MYSSRNQGSTIPIGPIAIILILASGICYFTFLS